MGARRAIDNYLSPAPAPVPTLRTFPGAGARPGARAARAYGPTRDLLNSKTENGGAGGRLRNSIVLRRLILSSVITRMGEIRKSLSV